MVPDPQSFVVVKGTDCKKATCIESNLTVSPFVTQCCKPWIGSLMKTSCTFAIYVIRRSFQTNENLHVAYRIHFSCSNKITTKRIITDLAQEGKGGSSSSRLSDVYCAVSRALERCSLITIIQRSVQKVGTITTATNIFGLLPFIFSAFLYQ